MIRTTDFDAVLSSSPLNKTAAVVVGGANETGELTPDQQRENLVAMVKKLEAQIQRASDKDQKKRLGVLKFRLQERIKELGLRKKYDKNFSNYFMDVAREHLTVAQFRVLRDEAFRRFNAAQSEGAA